MAFQVLVVQDPDPLSNRNLKLNSMSNSAPPPIKILFVCMGNICRSPAGEGVFRSLVQAEGLEDRFEIDSAGTISFHSGSPPDSRMREAGRRRGYTFEGSARGVNESDLDTFDWVIAMDRSNLRDLEGLRAGRAVSARLHLFSDFCMEHADKDVPDPYYGGDAGFEHVLDLLEDGCQHLLRSALETSQ